MQTSPINIGTKVFPAPLSTPDNIWFIAYIKYSGTINIINCEPYFTTSESVVNACSIGALNIIINPPINTVIPTHIFILKDLPFLTLSTFLAPIFWPIKLLAAIASASIGMYINPSTL